MRRDAPCKYEKCVIFDFNSCTEPSKEKLPYNDLPADVRNKFHSVYNYKEPPTLNNDGDTIDWYSAPFAECYNLNYGCDCEITNRAGIASSPKFVISSCDKTAKISWEILQRVFVIKNDSIYFPAANEGVTTTGEARSFDIKVDTLDFYIQKFN